MNRINVRLTFYYRYVDDIILAASSNKINLIFKKLSTIITKLTFTLERENNRSLNFLDLLLTISNNTIYIDWFHKETFSERFLSFHFSHPLRHKIGTIYNLIDRAFLLSHPKFQQKNLEFAIKLLLKNGYPLDLIFEKVNNRLKTLINKKSYTKDNNRKFIFPYIKKISELVLSTIDKTKYITGYRTLNNLRKFIKVHKDPNHFFSNNNVIYKIFCKDCLICQTKR